MSSRSLPLVQAKRQRPQLDERQVVYKKSAQQVASRIRFEVSLRRFSGICERCCADTERVSNARARDTPLAVQTASRRAGASVRLPRNVRTAGMVVAAPMPMRVNAMARRRGSGILLATSKPTPNASAARVPTKNPNCDGRRTRFMGEISAAPVSNSRAGSFARFLHHNETTEGRASWAFRLISPGR